MPYNPTVPRQTQITAPNFPQMPEWAASGPMGGMMLGRQMDDYRSKLGLAQLAQQMALQQQQAEMEEWKNESSVREAQRRAAIEEALATQKTIGRTKEADTRLKELGLRKGIATEDTDIASSRSKSMTQIHEDRVKQMESMVNELSSIAPSFKGPTGLAQFDAWAQKNGVSPQSPVYQMLSTSKTPEDFQVRLDLLQKGLRDNLTQQRASELQAQKDAAAMEREHVQGSYRLKAAASGGERQKSAPVLQFELMQEVSALPPDPTQWTPKDKQRLAQYQATVVSPALQKWQMEVDNKINNLSLVSPQLGAKADSQRNKLIQEGTNQIISQQPPAVQVYDKLQKPSGKRVIRGPDGKLMFERQTPTPAPMGMGSPARPPMTNEIPTPSLVNQIPK